MSATILEGLPSQAFGDTAPRPSDYLAKNPTAERRHLWAVPDFTEDISSSPEHHEREQLDRLAREIVDLHIEARESDNPDTFDPIEGLRVLKYHLIGAPDRLSRYNRHYPPGVKRTLRTGEQRTYGVECAAMIDLETGNMCLIRKDDVVDSHRPDDWMVANYDPRTGKLCERSVIETYIDYDAERGDRIELTVAPPAGPENMNRSLGKIILPLDRHYHTHDKVTEAYPKYYGHGTGSEAEQYVDEYTADYSELYKALCREMERRGIDPSILEARDTPAHARRLRCALGELAAEDCRLDGGHVSSRARYESIGILTKH